ncbi:MAG: alpha/beta fold hydrolase [bacterium]|nr:alpha/beta fold hydrolase [bacterium]
MMRTEIIPSSPKLAADICGEGETVLFLHGIGGNRTNWRAQLPVIGAHFHAVALDTRGYGDSEDYDGEVTFADFCADLARVLDHLGATAVHLVGLSMGGRIAFDFYGRNPGRVRTLTLADTSFTAPPTPERVQQALALRQQPLLDGKTPAEIAPEVAKSMTSAHTPPDALARIIESLSALHRDSYLKTLSAVVPYAAFPPLESIRVPTLVICGSEDPIAPPSLMRPMAEKIPGADYVQIDGAAHVSNIEAPEQFNAALLPFLLKHRGQP